MSNWRHFKIIVVQMPEKSFKTTSNAIEWLFTFDQQVALLSNQCGVFCVSWQWHTQSLVSICQSIAEIQLQVSFWHHASNSLLWYAKTVLSIDTKSITFGQHSLKMIRFDFGENRTNGLGGVRKSRFSTYIKMANKKFGWLWQHWYHCSQHDPRNH